MDGIPASMMGPKLAALPTEPMRRFAYIVGCGGFDVGEDGKLKINHSQVARDAGYADVGSAVRVRAHELMQDVRVIAAIHEVARKALGGLVPLAIRALGETIKNKDHPERLKAAAIVLDRTGFVAETKVTVEHTADMKVLDELVRRIAVERGIDPALLVGPNVIEGEAVNSRDDEVSRESTD